jgi:2-polyprenyl-6-hydroxyphenyl methylase/3-demethylubiquinone-9 3-methyltransferase
MKKFEFGKNWENFLKIIDEKRIKEAENSLKKLLNLENLKGKSFLDAGCGSGLFSLAAKNLGAEVYSFDFDENAVNCTGKLKKKYYKNDEKWIIEKGDILNKKYILSLGKFDIVYVWGVVHHTGNMWKAMENILYPVKGEGLLIISIYNDQGLGSKWWKIIKKTYNSIPFILKPFLILIVFLRLWMPTIIKDFIRIKPFRTWKNYYKQRGMSPWYDIIDWIGGYPFEVAKPEEVVNFFSKKGFKLEKIKTCGRGHGCNEFIFRKIN